MFFCYFTVSLFGMKKGLGEKKMQNNTGKTWKEAGWMQCLRRQAFAESCQIWLRKLLASIRPDSSISEVSITVISELINSEEEKRVMFWIKLRLDRYLNLKAEWLIIYFTM